MKKLAWFLTAVMLLSLIMMPVSAEDRPSETERPPIEEEEETVEPVVIPSTEELPDAETGPEIIDVVDEEVPLAEGEVGGDQPVEGDVVVTEPVTEPTTKPGRYVRYNDPDEGWTYILEEEVPLAETVPGDNLIHTEHPTPESGIGIVTEITGELLSSTVSTVDVGETIVIDARSAWKSPAYNEVIFRQEAVEQLAETGLPLEIETDLGVLTFDALMVKTMRELGEDAVLVMFRHEDSSITVLREDIGAFTVYELHLVCNGVPVDFNGGSINVSVPLEIGKGYVGYVYNGEILEQRELEIDAENKTASWDCNHFSTWVIYENPVAAEAVAEATPFNIWILISAILCCALVASWIVLGKRKNDKKENA